MSGPRADMPDVEVSRYPIRGQERRHLSDSKQYHLSVPGMGGCTHPVTDVVSLTPAEAEAAVLGLLATFPIADANRVAAEHLARFPATLRDASPDGDALIRVAGGRAPRGRLPRSRAAPPVADGGGRDARYAPGRGIGRRRAVKTPRARPYVPQHPLFVPNETFRPFTPPAHSVTASCVAHPATPVVLTWRFNVFDATGLPMVLTEPRHLTRPPALTLFRHLRDSLLGTGFTPDELGGTT